MSYSDDFDDSSYSDSDDEPSYASSRWVEREGELPIKEVQHQPFRSTMIKTTIKMIMRTTGRTMMIKLMIMMRNGDDDGDDKGDIYDGGIMVIWWWYYDDDDDEGDIWYGDMMVTTMTRVIFMMVILWWYEVPTTRVAPDPPRVSINEPRNSSVVIFSQIICNTLFENSETAANLIWLDKTDKSETIAKMVCKKWF